MNRLHKEPVQSLTERFAQQTATAVAQQTVALLEPLAGHLAEAPATVTLANLVAANRPLIGQLACRVVESMNHTIAANLGPLLDGIGERLTQRVTTAVHSLLRLETLLELAKQSQPADSVGGDDDALLTGGCAKKYGKDFISTIDDRDEMLGFLREVARLHYPDLIELEVKAGYINQGEQLALDIEEVLHEVGRPLDQVESLLDFACGYGRVTRHWVHKLGPARVTVSDIDTNAVDFVRRRFGVQGFCSVPDAHLLQHDGQYDAIIVISLFSHLPLSTWTAWLERLFRMLHSGGLLVFTTLGIDQYNVCTAEQKKGLETGVDGFYYCGVNETGGRLPATAYGGTIVSEEFVRRTVASLNLGTLLGSFPARLDHFQDIYVIRK